LAEKIQHEKRVVDETFLDEAHGTEEWSEVLCEDEQLRALFCPLAHFVIAGVQKAGTTSFARALDAHPNISIYSMELAVFDYFWHAGWDFRTLASRSTHKPVARVGMKIPSIAYLPHTQVRMRRLLPDVKLVVVLRHPVDRAFSQWRMNREVQPLQEDASFEDAIHRELRQLWRQPRSFRTAQFHYVQRGIYIEQMHSLVQRFPIENLLVVIFEELVSFPSEVLLSVQRFLGVPETPLQLPHVWMSNYSSDAMSADTRQRLLGIFEPYNRELFKLIGRAIPAWSQ
jgi:hypothetical protein